MLDKCSKTLARAFLEELPGAGGKTRRILVQDLGQHWPDFNTTWASFGPSSLMFAAGARNHVPASFCFRALFEHVSGFCETARLAGRNLASIVRAVFRDARAAEKHVQHCLCTFQGVGSQGIADGFRRHYPALLPSRRLQYFRANKYTANLATVGWEGPMRRSPCIAVCWRSHGRRGFETLSRSKFPHARSDSSASVPQRVYQTIDETFLPLSNLGPHSINLARIGPNVGQVCMHLERLRPTSGEIRSKVADVYMHWCIPV